MPDSVGQRVVRILYKEIVSGDLRKIQARSNDSDTGGGARDFRFGSYQSLLPVIKEMFPIKVRESRRRNGITDEIDVFKGEFCWINAAGHFERKDSFFEPPTDVRPSEGRIARVHEYPCFDTELIPHLVVGNRVLLLLLQRENGSVWPYFAEERTLRIVGMWDPLVADAICSCLDAKRSAGRSAIGYRDFTNGQRYCNGR